MKNLIIALSKSSREAALSVPRRSGSQRDIFDLSSGSESVVIVVVMVFGGRRPILT
jgi:hypothetical protein